MAASDNQKLTQLTKSSDASSSDAVYLVRNRGTTPVSRYMLYSDFFADAPIDFTLDTAPVAGGDLQGNNFTSSGFELVVAGRGSGAPALVVADLGTTVAFGAAGAFNVAIPNDLPTGWWCYVAQKGAGQLTFVPDASGNLRNSAGHTKTAAQYATVMIWIESNAGTAPEIYLTGETA